ncbi:MAG: hypothetical protein IJ485_06860 [Lachnospiraceae bacterium]|nr:hypothetical protein [Lachnospiraceae bacterium]
MDKKLFEEAREKIIGIQRERHGIGTLSEKTVHAILKYYYAPDEDMHEIPIENYVADIYTGIEIIEIQTRNFNKLRDKLNVFLKQYPVTIVYPIPYHKWLVWIDEDTGECTKRRKSPKNGTVYDAFRELYKIKSYLVNDNLRLKLVLMNVEEYRLLNGWSQDKKKGSTRYDRIPTELVEEVSVERIEDYMQFVPYSLPEQFTTADFAKEAHIASAVAQVVVHLLHYTGILERVGKKGRSYLYQVVE